MKKTKTLIQKDTCTPIFIVIVFTVAKIWKQAKCPSVDDGYKISDTHVTHTCTMEYYAAIKRTSLVAQTVKNLPAVQENSLQSLSWEDPLEREWQPTPVFLPGKSHGQRSLAGYRP